jgi:bifunctional DNA-binding transcriptional regulator/antitoxin component of YhaV-PrlF toxin-antitoxin module
MPESETINTLITYPSPSRRTLMPVVFVSKITTNGRICLGEKVMKALEVADGDYVQLIVNPKGPEVKLQKVLPYEI